MILYTRVANGVAMGFDTPGLSGCDPNQSRAQSWHHFVIIPEIAFFDGERSSLWRSFRASGAYEFATSYNREILQNRGADVRRFCPEVSAIAD